MDGTIHHAIEGATILSYLICRTSVSYLLELGTKCQKLLTYGVKSITEYTELVRQELADYQKCDESINLGGVLFPCSKQINNEQAHESVLDTPTYTQLSCNYRHQRAERLCLRSTS